MTNIILLTRSEEQNMIFKAHLADLDAEVLSRPLLRSIPIPLTQAANQVILDLDRFDHIIFISQNAVAFGLKSLASRWPQWPQSLHWYAVGPATAQRLQQAGIQAIVPQLASSEGLLELPGLKLPGGSNVLIMRGLGGRETLKQTLEVRGAVVDYIEVYRREAVAYGNEFIPHQDVEMVAMIYSGEALARLAELIQSHQHLHLIVPSRRLQRIAFSSGFAKVLLAKSQQDDSMLETLQAHVTKANS